MLDLIILSAQTFRYYIESAIYYDFSFIIHKFYIPQNVPITVLMGKYPNPHTVG